MPKFHDFADSFFSPVMWGEGGEFWPYLITAVAVIVAIIGVIVTKRLAYIETRVVTAFVLFMCAGLASFIPFNEANRHIAQNNITAKYDTSAMKFEKFEPDRKGLTGSNQNVIVSARYPAEAPDASHEIYFIFREGSGEPFLMRQDMTDEEFQNLEKAILKAE